MDHVDLQQRREDRIRARQASKAPRRSVTRDPTVLMGTGFVLGSAVSFYAIVQMGMFGLGTVLPLVAAAALLIYVLWLLMGEGPAENKPKLGSEKQLLLAILDAGGSMTPVEAALETSLTVDEAEEILTRLADRGHLVVESRDAALFYTLPGRRPAPETRTI